MKFRLKNGMKPVSWQLPISNVLLPKLDADGNEGPEKQIHYIPGTSSIYVEDYKGDKKGEDVWFEDGELEVRDSDKLLIEICKRHRWFNVHYELADDNATAEIEMRKFEMQDRANETINKLDEIQLQAVAMAIIGEASTGWSPIKCKAELKKRANEDPEKLLKDMDSPSYENRRTVSLALLRKIIKTDITNTAIQWADGGTIIRMAVGENAVERLAEFLAGTTDDVVVTRQRLKELTEKSNTSVGKQVAAAASTTVTANADAPEPTLEDLQAKYSELLKKDVPTAYKNNVEWIKGKIEEAEKAQK